MSYPLLYAHRIHCQAQHKWNWDNLTNPAFVCYIGSMKNNEQRTKRIDARIKPSLYKKVEKAAKSYKWSVSAIIEEALSEFVSKK
jgi:predicted HicB family RNase H-like nuclease